jgi:FixJ family two-component response regulator
MVDTPQIAIVDDDASVRKALSRVCRFAGYRVQLYDSCESFQIANAAENADFLILDVHLPGKSGLELQAELNTAGARCPMLFISAFDDEAVRQRAIDQGAIDFLGKPLDVKQVLEIIRQALPEN